MVLSKEPVANIFSNLPVRSFVLGLASGILLCAFVFFLLNLGGCGKTTFTAVSQPSAANHSIPSASFASALPRQKTNTIVMHDTLQVHDSLLIKTSVDLASDSLWQYSEIQGDDTLELAIDARTGELQYLNIFSPISEKEHSVAPDVKPVFPSSESYLKPFSLHYSLSAARDLFNPYWEAQANAELYLFGGVGVMSSAQYQYDGLFTQSRHTARLLVGALYHFQ